MPEPSTPIFTPEQEARIKELMTSATSSTATPPTETTGGEVKTISNSGGRRTNPPISSRRPPPTGPPPTVTGVGKGNLLYVSTLKGLAKCTGAYGTNGTNGTPVWTAVNTGLATANSKKLRHFNLDPFSSNGTSFGAGWAATDDGVYRVTGLPNAGTWTAQLTAAQANTLAANPGAGLKGASGTDLPILS